SMVTGSAGGERFVLRVLDNAGWLAEEPDVAEPDAAALAAQLATIHAHPAESLRWSFTSWVDAEALASPAWSTKPALWQTVIDRWRSGPLGQPAVIRAPRLSPRQCVVAGRHGERRGGLGERLPGAGGCGRRRWPHRSR